MMKEGYTDVILVIVLERAIVPLMKSDQNCDDFAHAQAAIALPLLQATG
jgi:hypothetical protein